MQANQFLQASVLDIIFQNRNKQYGAYSLRKFYNQRLLKSLGITFLLASIALVFMFAIKPKETILGIISIDEPTLKELEQPKPEEKKKEKIFEDKNNAKQKENTKTVQAKTAAHTIPLIVNKADVLKIDEIKDDDILGITKSDVGVNKIPVGVVPISTGNLPADSSTGKVVQPKIDIYTASEAAEVMPEYPGGKPALKKFLEKNLQTPDGIEAGEVISVKVRFVVQYNGKITQFEILQDGGEQYNDEVLRVLKKMPNWIPGKTKGTNVSVYFTQSVTFSAQE
jgi:periplasmic protein TonB